MGDVVLALVGAENSIRGMTWYFSGRYPHGIPSGVLLVRPKAGRSDPRGTASGLPDRQRVRQQHPTPRSSPDPRLSNAPEFNLNPPAISILSSTGSGEQARSAATRPAPTPGPVHLHGPSKIPVPVHKNTRQPLLASAPGPPHRITHEGRHRSHTSATTAVDRRHLLLRRQQHRDSWSYQRHTHRDTKGIPV